MTFCRLATFTEQGELSDAAIFVRGNVIEWVGRDSELPQALSTADTVLELRDHVMIPGTCPGALMVCSAPSMAYSLSRQAVRDIAQQRDCGGVASTQPGRGVGCDEAITLRCHGIEGSALGILLAAPA